MHAVTSDSTGLPAAVIAAQGSSGTSVKVASCWQRFRNWLSTFSCFNKSEADEGPVFADLSSAALKSKPGVCERISAFARSLLCCCSKGDTHEH